MLFKPAEAEVFKKENENSSVLPNKTPQPKFSGKDFISKAFLKKYLPKIIFGILAIVVLFELFSLLKITGKNNSFRVDKPKPVNSLARARIVLEADKPSYVVNDKVSLKVRLTTGGRATDSTDLILKYDPKILSASTSGIRKGNLYQDYVISEVDQKNGTVRVSAITPPNYEGFVGVGEFAIVDFKALANGTSKIVVDFTKNSTTDSNVVETGSATDLLDEVYNTDIMVGGAGQPVFSKADSSCDGYVQYCNNMAGQTGRQFCGGGKLDNGSCVWDPNMTTSCEICSLGF